MDLFEYQARDMFEAHGVPVLAGQTATTPEEAKAAAEQIGAKSGGVTVVKAQVKTGGRGKAGGVKVAKSADEAEQYAKDILGMDIKGHTVGTVMIAQGAKIAEEYYFSILLDRANRSYLAMCSKEGGVEIEQLAVERPEALARIEVDPNVGIDGAKADEIVKAAGFDDETAATLDRNADNDPTPLLGCFQGPIPSTWLHRRHFANSLQSSPRRGGPPTTAHGCRVNDTCSSDEADRLPYPCVSSAGLGDLGPHVPQSSAGGAARRRPSVSRPSADGGRVDGEGVTRSDVEMWSDVES